MPDQDFNIKVVTTADTSGLQKTREEIQRVNEAAQKARQDAGAKALFAAEDARKAGTPTTSDAAPTSLTRSFSAAAAFGYIVARVINGIAQETNKVTAELDKQGEHLVDLEHKWTDMAKAATSAEDVAKIAASGTKEIDALGKAIQKAANPDLSIGATMVDSLVKAFKNTKDAMGPNEQLAQELFKGLQQDQEQLIQMNAHAIELGRTFQDAFDKRKTEPLSDALANVADEMSKAKNEQDGLTGAMLRTKAGIDRYNELAVILANLTRQTDLLMQADARRERALEAANRAAEKELSQRRSFEEDALKSASPQAKAILRNEEAARKARAAGDERTSDLFQKTADRLKQSATPDQQSEASQLGKLLKDGNTILSQILAQFR